MAKSKKKAIDMNNIDSIRDNFYIWLDDITPDQDNKTNHAKIIRKNAIKEREEILQNMLNDTKIPKEWKTLSKELLYVIEKAKQDIYYKPTAKERAEIKEMYWRK